MKNKPKSKPNNHRPQSTPGPLKKKRAKSAGTSTSPLNAFDPAQSAIDAAIDYLNRGYAPVPITKGEKAIFTTGWQNMIVTPDNVHELFQADGNCGLRTGPKSGNLADVDVDDKGGLELAELILPTTAMTSGREGQGPSHYWYIAPDAKTDSWKDDLGMIVELRADRVQTLVPPSIHEEGDRVVWYGTGAAATVQAEELKRRCVLFACAMTLGRHWPSEGNRHDAALGIAGMLLQAGLPDGEAEQILLAASARGGDEQAEDRAAAIATTRARIAANEPIVSGGRVQEQFGDATYKLLRKWLRELGHAGSMAAPDAPDGSEESPATRSLATLLLSLTDDLELFHLPGDEHEGWATTISDGRRETHRIRSERFRSMLCARLWRAHHRPANQAALESAITTLEARAVHDGPPIGVEFRVVGDEEMIYIDLGDTLRHFIHVTRHGWSIERDAPVRFFRPRGQLPFPIPERGGTLTLLRPFVNVESEDDWLIFLAWIIYTFQSASDFVILTIFGEHDSAKSTVARLAKEFTDPGIASARAAPASMEDLAVSARNSRTISYDNLSSLSPELADAFCRMATGTCFAGRRHYTNEEEYLIEAKRPIVINAIPDVLERPDLIDRVACIWLPPISDENRIPTAEFKARLDGQRTLIFGALLDALSGVLKLLPTVDVVAPPRMADFARWGTALEQYLGYEPGSFMRAYENNRAALVLTGLDDFVLLAPLRLLLAANKGPLEGTPLQLLGKLNALKTPSLEVSRKSQGWPRTAGGLSSLLRRHRRGLEKLGIILTTWRAATRDRTRFIRIELRGEGGARTAAATKPGPASTKSGTSKPGLKGRLKKAGGPS